MKSRKEKTLELMLSTMETAQKQLIEDHKLCHIESIKLAAENTSLRCEIIRIQGINGGLREKIADLNGVWGTEEDFDFGEGKVVVRRDPVKVSSMDWLINFFAGLKR